MDDQSFDLASALVPKAYTEQARSAARTLSGHVHSLLAQRRWPEEGWGPTRVELFLSQVAQMDSNNFCENVGLGEREGRVAAESVRRRHCGFAHGVGRSGDIAEPQPKAAGSSLLFALCNRLALQFVQFCGVHNAKAALVLPVATGVSLSLSLTPSGFIPFNL